MYKNDKYNAKIYKKNNTMQYIVLKNLANNNKKIIIAYISK